MIARSPVYRTALVSQIKILHHHAAHYGSSRRSFQLYSPQAVPAVELRHARAILPDPLEIARQRPPSAHDSGSLQIPRAESIAEHIILSTLLHRSKYLYEIGHLMAAVFHFSYLTVAVIRRSPPYLRRALHTQRHRQRPPGICAQMHPAVDHPLTLRHMPVVERRMIAPPAIVGKPAIFQLPRDLKPTRSQRNRLKTRKSGTHTRNRPGIGRAYHVAPRQPVVDYRRALMLHSGRRRQRTPFHLTIQLLKPQSRRPATVHAPAFSRHIVAAVTHRRRISAPQLHAIAIAQTAVTLHRTHRSGRQHYIVGRRQRATAVRSHIQRSKLTAAGRRLHRSLKTQTTQSSRSRAKALRHSHSHQYEQKIDFHTPKLLIILYICRQISSD